MQQTKTTNLIAALEAERVRRGLDHRAFSTILGIHESGWHRLRTSERPPSLDVLTTILQKLPRLRPVVCSYMSEREISENPRQTNDAEKPSPKNLSGNLDGNKGV